METYRFFPISELKNWNRRQYWIGWILSDIRNWWYRVRYGINVNCRTINHTTIPKFGAAVQKKAGIIQINDEHVEGNFIRLVPVEYNHGILVEIWRDGKIWTAYNMGYNFLSGIIGACTDSAGDVWIDTVKDFEKREGERNNRT